MGCRKALFPGIYVIGVVCGDWMVALKHVVLLAAGALRKKPSH